MKIPSQKNMSQTRRTEDQGSVRAKMHINHSIINRMGSSFCFVYEIFTEATHE